MLHLLQIDVKKMWHYRTFWIVYGLYVLALIATTQNEMFNALSLYASPYVLQNASYAGSLFKIILGAIVAMNIANEFTYRTAKQNIIDGLSRKQFVLSKILTNVLLTLSSMLLVFLVSVPSIIAYNEGVTINNLLTGAKVIIDYGIHLFAFLSISLTFGIMTRRTGLTIMLLISLPFIESILTKIMKLPAYLASYLPMQAIEKLVHTSFLPHTQPNLLQVDSTYFLTIGTVLAWCFIVNYIGYLWLKKHML